MHRNTDITAQNLKLATEVLKKIKSGVQSSNDIISAAKMPQMLPAEIISYQQQFGIEKVAKLID